jgi:gamma-glutamyl-gamma-aminobutyraldehyde dehydrogenase
MNESKNIDWVGRYSALTPRVRNYIDGRWLDGSGLPLEKLSPRDGRVLCRFGAGSPEDVDHAVAIARQAYEDGRWSEVPVRSRKNVLLNLASLIEKHKEEFALLESLDVGKPISDALRFDVPTAAALLRSDADD